MQGLKEFGFGRYVEESCVSIAKCEVMTRVKGRPSFTESIFIKIEQNCLSYICYWVLNYPSGKWEIVCNCQFYVFK